ncbi:hypothetical protein V8F06_000849 [Rhypophila decipiens]
MASTLRASIISATLVALIQVPLVHPQSTDVTPGCDVKCTGAGVGDCPAIYGWMARSDMGGAMGAFGSTTQTMTILTVINTALDETSISTVTPWATDRGELYDDDGTVMQVITWRSTRGAELLTTTLTFPTMFVAYPDSYTWAGTLLTTTEGSEGMTECVTVDQDSPSTITLSSKPQPTSFFNDEVDPATMTGDDLRGHDYAPLQIGAGGSCENEGWIWLSLASLFPEQAAMTTCWDPDVPGPHFGGYLSTYWSTVSTTTYIGDDGLLHTSTVTSADTSRQDTGTAAVDSSTNGGVSSAAATATSTKSSGASKGLTSCKQLGGLFLPVITIGIWLQVV